MVRNSKVHKLSALVMVQISRIRHTWKCSIRITWGSVTERTDALLLVSTHSMRPDYECDDVAEIDLNPANRYLACRP